MDRIDLTGRRFGKLVVERFSHTEKDRGSAWLCVCDCGTKKAISGGNLKNGSSKSCGSCRDISMMGKSFGEWIVISEAKKRGYNYYWLCRCSCGTIREVSEKSLKGGKSKSCGCKNIKSITGKTFGELNVISEEIKNGEHLCTCKCSCGIIKDIEMAGLVSGRVVSCGHIQKRNFLKIVTRHGLSGTRIENIYRCIISRCFNPANPSYKYYGGRGIYVCEEWSGGSGFINFYSWAQINGYDRFLSIDRIDNNKGYSPENCRWITHKGQMNNMSRNHYISHNGLILTISEWADHLGVKYKRIEYLLRYYNFNMDVAISKLKINI
jgi:hypothetical protein